MEVTTARRVPEGEDDEGGGVVVTRGNVRSVVHGGRSYVCAKCSAGRELSRLQGHAQAAAEEQARA